jgi:hypothetical protein
MMIWYCSWWVLFTNPHDDEEEHDDHHDSSYDPNHQMSNDQWYDPSDDPNVLPTHDFWIDSGAPLTTLKTKANFLEPAFLCRFVLCFLFLFPTWLHSCLFYMERYPVIVQLDEWMMNVIPFLRSLPWTDGAVLHSFSFVVMKHERLLWQYANLGVYFPFGRI